MAKDRTDLNKGRAVGYIPDPTLEKQNVTN